ncbi:hypothetical protein D9758_010366 [Tetrapyrgos nigripes]|uniref:Uncharacterized protein n=1 Tax=Tetrapyrgos nigripes TaxID=182062 RepID=A0A8H5D128_9AGAR|nr:hypothetical protein D9758_010366 [Tetrapyrgos nigripes]
MAILMGLPRHSHNLENLTASFLVDREDLLSQLVRPTQRLSQQGEDLRCRCRTKKLVFYRVRFSILLGRTSTKKNHRRYPVLTLFIAVMSSHSTNAPKPDLSKILTPALYTDIYKLAFPWTHKPDGSLDIKWIADFLFRGVPNPSREIYDKLHHQVLKPISVYCPLVPQDIVSGSYLPSPTDPLYPERVFALLSILDQAPRRLYSARGLNSRYTFGYFDQISHELVKTLISKNAFPDTTEALTKLGYSFEDALIRRSWIYTPLVHSEDFADHELMEGKTEAIRKEVEVYSGRTDPYRATKDKDAQDPTVFRKLIFAGPPESNDFADFMFWLFRVYDVHATIIRRYGQYPYRNVALGRMSTEDEKRFLEETDWFGQPMLTEEEVKKIRKQKEEGVWEPLHDGRPE